MTRGIRLRRLIRAHDAGMATAEMAVALPVLMLLVLTAVYAVQVMGMRVRCLDAAREVARAAARGDPRAPVIGREVLPGSAVSIRRSERTVTAVVSIRLHPLGGDLPAVTVREQVTAATEPAAGLVGSAITRGEASERVAVEERGPGPPPISGRES